MPFLKRLIQKVGAGCLLHVPWHQRQQKPKEALDSWQPPAEEAVRRQGPGQEEEHRVTLLVTWEALINFRLGGAAANGFKGRLPASGADTPPTTTKVLCKDSKGA